MFGFFGKQKSAKPEQDAAKKSTEEFNSLVEDQHVDFQYQKHKAIFDLVKS